MSEIELKKDIKNVKAAAMILDTVSSIRIYDINKKAGKHVHNAWKDLNKATIILESHSKGKTKQGAKKEKS